MPLVVGVVARRRPRLPPRPLHRQPLGRRLPVVHVPDRERRVPAGDAGRVRHQVPHEHVLLALGRELRPVVAHRRVHVQLAALDQQQRRQREHALRRRPAVDDRVLGPRGRALLVAVSAPDVDDGLPVEIDRDRRPQLLAVELLRERVPHPGEPVVAAAVHLGHKASSSRPRHRCRAVPDETTAPPSQRRCNVPAGTSARPSPPRHGPTEHIPPPPLSLTCRRPGSSPARPAASAASGPSPHSSAVTRSPPPPATRHPRRSGRAIRRPDPADPLDVTDRDAVFAAVKEAHDRFGGLDVVVNNAGYGQFGMVEEISEAEARAQIETNVFGALWVTQAALPYLRAQGPATSCRSHHRRDQRVPEHRHVPRLQVGARGIEPVARPGGRRLRHQGHHRARRLLDRLGAPRPSTRPRTRPTTTTA